MSMTMDQRTTALQKAYEVKRERARIRKILSERTEYALALSRLADVIESEPGVQGMRVIDLLTYSYRIGTDRARRYLLRIQASEMRTVGELTDRQRDLLMECLRNGN